MKTQVRVVTDIKKFDPCNIEKTDGIAVLGATRQQTANFIRRNLAGVSREDFRNSLDVSWVKDGEYPHPETSERNLGEGGNVIAIAANELKQTGLRWGKEDANTTGGFIVVHGAGHLAGLADWDGQANTYYRLGLYLMTGGSGIEWDIKYAKNTKEQCPACLRDFTTNPTSTLINALIGRFGNNTPSSNMGIK